MSYGVKPILSVTTLKEDLGFSIPPCSLSFFPLSPGTIVTPFPLHNEDSYSVPILCLNV